MRFRVKKLLPRTVIAAALGAAGMLLTSILLAPRSALADLTWPIISHAETWAYHQLGHSNMLSVFLGQWRRDLIRIFELTGPPDGVVWTRYGLTFLVIGGLAWWFLRPRSSDSV